MHYLKLLRAAETRGKLEIDSLKLDMLPIEVCEIYSLMTLSIQHNEIRDIPVYMYVCLYVCIYVCLCVCLCVSVCVFVCIHTHTHTHTHVNIFLYMYLYKLI